MLSIVTSSSSRRALEVPLSSTPFAGIFSTRRLARPKRVEVVGRRGGGRDLFGRATAPPRRHWSWARAASGSQPASCRPVKDRIDVATLLTKVRVPLSTMVGLRFSTRRWSRARCRRPSTQSSNAPCRPLDKLPWIVGRDGHLLARTAAARQKPSRQESRSERRAVP